MSTPGARSIKSGPVVASTLRTETDDGECVVVHLTLNER